MASTRITFSIFVDGTYWDFPNNFERTWEKGLVSSVSAKEYIIEGPQLAGLYAAKEIMINLSGVPTEYDSKGYVSKKEKFVWYFRAGSSEVTKQDQINYTYETSMVETKKCIVCNGIGEYQETYKCNSCSGTGKLVGVALSGKKEVIQCPTCKGTGHAFVFCHTCSGKGISYFPKSQQAPIKNLLTWSGWEVEVNTTPSGASVRRINTKTGSYEMLGSTTPCKIIWLCSLDKSCPIVVEYNGHAVKLLPLDMDSKGISKVEVDFSGTAPIVTKGKKVY